MPCIGVAVETKDNCVVECVGPAISLRLYMVNLDANTLVAVTQTAMSSG